ncbi:RUN domain-containing protein 1 isoform X2 [Microplitis demolitor]|uniref:RUN domain-containing protein 1 isoform X2 n=1 Tax=Microplitis demolitor TaxID=69319 RepID=UPI0004CD8C2D|nr:RUN domain-containing protein 1 isoform X2 [Microplitis demolitor]
MDQVDLQFFPKEQHCINENEEYGTSDENERPSGERWAPVGANDVDDDFNSECKYNDNMEILSYNMDRLKVLEEEQDVLNSSLIALTTHFAQVQFRLRQIVDAPTDQKESLLKELEEFAFRGIPDVSNILSYKSDANKALVSSTETSLHKSFEKCTDTEVESKIAQQKTKQKELINQLKIQLEDLERYAYETDGQDLPQSVILERQNLLINHLKEKLNFEVDDLCKLPIDDLRWQVDHAINEIVNPLKMKEQLVNQLKTQVSDLERFIHYLQGEVSTETFVCTCTCSVHKNSARIPAKKLKKSFSQKQTNDGNHTKTLNTVRKVITLLHLYLLSQLGCGSDQVRRDINKNSGVPVWRDLRTRLDIAVEHVLENVADMERNNDAKDYSNYSSDLEMIKAQFNARITAAVRKHLAISIKDLIQHGLTYDIRASNSVVPFVGCFPPKKTVSHNFMHAWELIIKYYEIKNGHLYNSSPAQRLSQSFNLDLVNGRNASPKQTLLITIGNIIATHTPYKRSHNSHFKAFICAALNANKLVVWLTLILQCQYLLENYYTSWSYVVKTGT